MDLERFLAECNMRYKNKILEIKDEFILENCEKFLFLTYKEQKEAMEYLEQIKTKETSFVPNVNVTNFIKQFDDINWNNEIAFIFPEKNTANFIMAKELSKKAKRNYIINNIFNEDETINWIAIFNKTQTEEINLMFYILYSFFDDDNFGGYKLFGKGLMYYTSVLEYKQHILYTTEFAHFQGNQLRRDTNPINILEARKTVKMLLRQKYFKDGLDIYNNFYKILLPFFSEWYENAKKVVTVNSQEIKIRLQMLKSELVANGLIKSRWKSEQLLFMLVKRIYSDAIFQYCPIWLEPQSLDIFIPSQNIGIEYQGIQHYQIVDFFKGEEGFKHRKELDKIKREKCEANNISLIEWSYTDNISEKNLKKMIKTVKNKKNFFTQ